MNKDKFKRAFTAVQTPDDFALDLEENTMTKRMKVKRAAITAIAALAVVGSSTAVYAADLGGIQRQMQVWLHGDQTTATMTVGDGEDASQYTISDSQGNVVQGGGGVVENSDGTYRPATAEEMQEEINSPQTDTVDGRMYLYYKDQKMDLTDKFDKDGLCYVTLKDGDKTLYITILKSGALRSSQNRYATKSEMERDFPTAFTGGISRTL